MQTRKQVVAELEPDKIYTKIMFFLPHHKEALDKRRDKYLVPPGLEDTHMHGEDWLTLWQ